MDTPTSVTARAAGSPSGYSALGPYSSCSERDGGSAEDALCDEPP